MALSIGMVGLPNVGRTTIFNAITLTEGGERSDYMFSTTEPVRGAVAVPDERLERIHEHIETEKVVSAQMTVVDIPGLVAGSSHGEGMGVGFLGAIKESDVLLHVVRCFEKEGVQHVTGAVDPAADAEVVELELAQVDLQTINRNIERVSKRARIGDVDALSAKAAFEKARDHLNADRLLRHAELTAQERALLGPLFLMTIKPVLFVANVGDDDLSGNSSHVQGLREYAQRTGAHSIHLCGDIEAELIRMDDQDRTMFMEELGLRESGLVRLIHEGFDLLGLRTFFTAGPKEIHAWTYHKGDTAPVAAGEIHTDFSSKFIRAEIYSFDDLMEHKSEAAIKAAGKMRVEGKAYVMQEGDVCHFLIGK